MTGRFETRLSWTENLSYEFPRFWLSDMDWLEALVHHFPDYGKTQKLPNREHWGQFSQDHQDDDELVELLLAHTARPAKLIFIHQLLFTSVQYIRPQGVENRASRPLSRT
ncbi:hypothetical protein ASPSYDRAFT_1071289 [Aspergillus sydowii CBS 593.65]|uniref:Uncharacterized protein n=1 Tax=Aspergillus sydowii CBS 593.65 TaxID=1036612 RepID=A0A1L9TE09_9EURO|nr:uncharacterized protein ASPSYDRAFT_1071289 [Aspergillus sydowii CBS 593.65]OJJ57670.1 hypothetical protein ASPSYDRAFT_1071289 [Aspergillus sydowii CBS 593.65]